MARAKELSNVRLAYTCGIAQPDGSRYFPTMAELAKEAGVSLSHITHVAGEQRWTEERFHQQSGARACKSQERLLLSEKTQEDR